MSTKLPKIALGAWSWGVGVAGGEQVFGNHLLEADLKPVFEKAMECGLNLWDTAAVYGEGTSERILGSFVKDMCRDSVILSTKFTPQIASSSLNAMQEMIDGSKERLHTDVTAAEISRLERLGNKTDVHTLREWERRCRL